MFFGVMRTSQLESEGREMTLRRHIVPAIHEHDLGLLQRLHNDNSEALFRVEAVFGGGTWMHQAAAYGDPNILQWLETIGFDINEPGSRESDRPIVCAAQRGNVPNMSWLLERHVTLDVDASVRNALFGAIVGRSVRGADLLLKAGIDADARYNSPTMTDMDAMAFAIFRSDHAGSDELIIANMIAEFLAKGDANKASVLLKNAAKRAARNGKPVVQYIVQPE